jgi:glycosyltransferase involved in cell wall biosynthesis
MRLSSIIPNYNRETLIGETIENLLEQTHPPDEIIVVDDGSTDRSVAVIQSFGNKVRLLQQTNQGPGAARNAGLQMATGDFIQFQDSDDLFSRNKLEVQADLLERTGGDIAFSPWVKVRIEGKQVTLENQVLQQRMPPVRLELPCWWLRGWSTVFQSLLFRRSFLDRVGLYRTDLLIGEDGELFFRALTHSSKLVFSDQALTLYRLHETNKLTQDQGTSQDRRVIDWARSLRYMIECADACKLKIDGMTRLLLRAELKKQLRYLRAISKPPADLVDFLAGQVATLPGPLLDGLLFGIRLAEHIRLRTKGSRWMSAYQAAPLTGSQRALLNELGFEVV